MKALLEVLRLSERHLEKQGVSHPRRAAEEVIADALGVSRMDLYLQFDRPLTAEELDHCRERLARKAKREPFQYIKGSVLFYGCDIKVMPSALIPRQETEILVDLVAESLRSEDLRGKVLWDVCTGSGCIGIALKKKFPELAVVLSDISSAALSLAKENASRAGVDVAFLQGDMLSVFEGKKADFFVCNPPYISESEYEHLEPEVREYEPKIALVGGKTGLEYYMRLAQELNNYLKSKAKVWLEIGHDQGEAVLELFSNSAFPQPWKERAVKKDWSGKDRFFFLEKE